MFLNYKDFDAKRKASQKIANAIYKDNPRGYLLNNNHEFTMTVIKVAEDILEEGETYTIPMVYSALKAKYYVGQDDNY